MTIAERFDLADTMSSAFKRSRGPVMRELQDWAAWWRDVLLMQGGAAEGVVNVDRLGELDEDAARYSRADIVRFLQALLDTRQNLARNVQSRIALDALLLGAPTHGKAFTAS
jgi:DNA polymerase III gamma/tau subunit